MTTAGLKSAFLSSRPALLRFLRARLRDQAAAEDLLQELWIKLESTPTGPVAQPESYLFRMANNLVLDMRRAESRRMRRDEAWTDSQSGVDRERDDRPSAETILLARERLAAMTLVLDALPERTARAFRMCRIQGLKQKEIAAHLGISVSAVEKHLQRAYAAVLTGQRQFDVESPPLRRPPHEKDPNDA